MRIETLLEFIEFAKYQNLSIAAKKLFISQPALSNHIVSLEKELGIKLVNRGQTLELTASGKAFFEGCCEIIDSYNNVLERVHSLAGKNEQGSITIKMAFTEGAGSIKLIEFVSAFKQQNPAISVKFIKDGKNTVMDDLLHGVVDCAQLFNYSIPSTTDEDPCLERLTIDRASITVAARKEHPLMSKDTVSFEDIHEYPYAMPAGASFEECQLSVQQIYRDRGYELKNIHYKAVDSLTDLIYSETKDEEILILGPSPALPGTMAFRKFEPEEYQEFCLVFRKDNKNPVLDLFVQFIKDQ